MDFSDAADAYVVNSCSVTAVSDRKSRQQLYRIRREHPAAVAALCGCYVQTHLDEVRKLDVDLLAGTGGRMEFLDRLESAVMEKQGLSGHAPAEFVDQALRRREFEVLPAGGLEGSNIRVDRAAPSGNDILRRAQNRPLRLKRED